MISNLGLAFNVHYCDNKIASVSLNILTDKTVDECCRIVEKNSKCCKDKIIQAELKSDQIIVKSLSFEVNFFPTTYDWKLEVFDSKFNFIQRDNLTYYCDVHAPPLYLLYSQYTFYS